MRVLLLTGRPGIGKTTVVRRVASAMAGLRLGGFLTDEVRENGRRVGFRIETFDGQSDMLARANRASRHRVGRYGVDVPAIDRVVDRALGSDVDLVIVDEIGKMECFSARFVGAMRRLLASGPPLVATIALRGGGFIEEVKGLAGVGIWEVTHANRDEMPARVTRSLSHHPSMRDRTISRP